MKKCIVLLLSVSLLIITAGAASAVPVLYGSGLTVNGAYNWIDSGIYTAPEIGGVVTDVTGFDMISGSGYGYDVPSALGSVTVTYDPGVAGFYSIFGYFDVEIDEGATTYTNESGSGGGSLLSGQSGSIVEKESDPLVPGGHDIALEMGWMFDLDADQLAVITFLISDIAPDVGTYFLSQTDLTSGEMIYLTSTLDIQGGAPPVNPVPEPATMVLLGIGLTGLCAVERKRFLRNSVEGEKEREDDMPS